MLQQHGPRARYNNAFGRDQSVTALVARLSQIDEPPLEDGSADANPHEGAWRGREVRDQYVAQHEAAARASIVVEQIEWNDGLMGNR